MRAAWREDPGNEESPRSTIRQRIVDGTVVPACVRGYNAATARRYDSGRNGALPTVRIVE